MTGIYNKVGVESGTGGEVRQGGALGVLGAVLTFLSVLLILLTFPFTAWSCVQVVLEYERAVIFRLGRVVKGSAKGPGLIWFIPWLDVVQKVDLRTLSVYICPQQIQTRCIHVAPSSSPSLVLFLCPAGGFMVLTADGVPLLVEAVAFYRVVDPTLWCTRVQNGCHATHWLVQATIMAALGAHTLTDLLTQWTSIATRMEEVLHSSSRLWGVQVQRVKLRDLKLPIRLQRSLASEAEAQRTARAMVVVAEGEMKASRTLTKAASELPPVAMRLRYLQTLESVDSSASIVVWIFPTEILQLNSKLIKQRRS